MTAAGTPMPGEDPGALIEDADRLDEIGPAGEPNEGGKRPPAGPVPEETPGADDGERQRS